MDATVWFAVGTGVSLGWILCRLFTYMSPDSVVRAFSGIKQEIDRAREEKTAEIARLSESFAGERVQWRGVVAELRELLRAVPAGGGGPHPSSPPSQLEPPAATSHQPMQNGAGESANLRRRLLDMKLPPEKVEAILGAVARGDLEQLQVEPLLQETIDGMIRDETGVR